MYLDQIKTLPVNFLRIPKTQEGAWNLIERYKKWLLGCLKMDVLNMDETRTYNEREEYYSERG